VVRTRRFIAVCIIRGTFISPHVFFVCDFLKVNEGVREKENSDRLEWLQRCVQCDGLEEELVFNSMTNSLGPRKFLHFGVLHKVHYENIVCVIVSIPEIFLAFLFFEFAETCIF
jgi:hypothetical protein